MKKWVKTGLMGILALGLLVTATGCGGGAPAGDKATAKKTIKVATDAAYAPFEWKNEKGEIVGFDIDLIKAVGKEMNAEIELVDTPFDGIIAALTNKNVDMLISAMTITEKRKESIDFSKPYFVAVQAIAVKEGSPVKKFEDIKDLKVGVQNSTTGQYVVEKLMGEKSPKIFRYDTTPLAMNMLNNGDVDVVVADKPVVQHFLKNNPSAKMTLIDDTSFEKEDYGIAVRKGEGELLKQVNDALDKLEKNGTIKQISEKYLTGK
ncbi:transporter substrate-binding domain-containing protein [Heliobacterium undosum]|uniref:Transporter substrate-binding domain-containing protein n=1 Tax=Heliomicrobium undosum TaxID=121734 RepID=A0A845L931_9FIRM|nr:basic amino acid ABC transporter substrate-binding protein [Heliomicrobium undosum]MZP29431.1 transporter substrate-binding domain-containing protein [Heliomicrobium undosum]